jgi:hypothetical protein
MSMVADHSTASADPSCRALRALRAMLSVDTGSHEEVPVYP